MGWGLQLPAPAFKWGEPGKGNSLCGRGGGLWGMDGRCKKSEEAEVCLHTHVSMCTSFTPVM